MTAPRSSIDAWQRVEEMLFAGNSLAKAQRVFECFINKRPRARLTIRQRTWVLQEWPPSRPLRAKRWAYSDRPSFRMSTSDFRID